MRASASAPLPVLTADPPRRAAIEAPDAASPYRLPSRRGHAHRYGPGAVETRHRSVAMPEPQIFRARHSRLRR